MRHKMNIPPGAKPPAIQLRTHGLGELTDYVYALVVSFYKGQLLLSRHAERDTWETQGGHIEMGETPIEAAKRELYEESGALEFTIEPVGDCAANGTTGVYFVAHITKRGSLPEGSEMAQVKSFEYLPLNLTYAGITPVIYTAVKAFLKKKLSQ